MSDQNQSDLQRQYQKYTDSNGEPVGDCYRTALACLLEIPRDKVPHFAEIYKEGPELAWWTASIRFVRDQLPGWTLVCVRPIYPVYQAPESSPRRVVLTGDSPRGSWGHSVLVDATDGSLAWDPFPGGTGVGLPRDIIALERLPEHVNRSFDSRGISID